MILHDIKLAIFKYYRRRAGGDVKKQATTPLFFGIKNIYSWIRVHYPYLLFICFSLIPFFWHRNNLLYPYIGGGDFISPIHIDELLKRRLFVWEPLLWGGIDGSSFTCMLFPYYIFFYVSSLLGFSSLISSLFFLATILFVSQCGMTYFLNYIFKNRLRIKPINNKYLIFSGSVIYGFSPYVIGVIAPGHILNLVLVAVFPYILCLYDEILISRRINLKTSLVLYVCFSLAISGASYGIGQIYLLGCILFPYWLFTLLIERRNFLSSLLRLIWTYVLLFVSQGWWIIPLISTRGSLTSINPLNPLNFGFGIATQYANILNIFLGRADGILYFAEFKQYFRKPEIILFIGIFCLLINAIDKGRKKKYLWVLLSMLIFGVFMTKGSQPPFGSIFEYLYNHIPGFTSFRRPVSKFYWMFLFFYISLAVYGGMLLNKYLKIKLYKLAMIFIIGICTGYLIFFFIKTPFLGPFAIPSYYSEAKGYLDKDNATRILLLPGLNGLTPFFNNALNGFGGTDFLDEAWGVPTVIPDDTNYSPKYPSKEVVNAIGRDIRNERSICELGRQMMLSHIAVRFDLSKNISVEDDPQELDQKLKRNPDIVNVQTFHNELGGIIIYSIRKECRNSLLSLIGNTEARMDYQIINPTMVMITISGLKNEASLQFLQNYTNTWKLYPYTDKENRIKQAMQFFYQPMFEKTHILGFSYANQWKINAKEIRTNLSNKYYSENPDGTITIRLLLLYKPQIYFYIGILFSIILGLFLIIGTKITKFKK